MKNKKDRLQFLKGKTKPVRTFIILLFVIFLLLLTYLVGSLLYMRNGLGGQGSSADIDPDEYFKDCTLLNGQCTDASCDKYSYCGDDSFQACRVYDCQDTYGVYTADLDGQGHIKNEPKPNMNQVLSEKDACSGDLQVLSQDCVNGSMQIKVKISTKGECKIGGFTLAFAETGTRANDFTAAGDGTYLVTADSCGTVSTITPQTEDGIALELSRK
jgi:hypothetical protein